MTERELLRTFLDFCANRTGKEDYSDQTAGSRLSVDSYGGTFSAGSRVEIGTKEENKLIERFFERQKR